MSNPLATPARTALLIERLASAIAAGDGLQDRVTKIVAHQCLTEARHALQSDTGYAYEAACNGLDTIGRFDLAAKP